MIRTSLLSVAALFALLLTLILHKNMGTLTYTLDDVYIHMSLAENIARGHWGINMETLSSPSSSLIFPLILAALRFVGGGGGLFLYVPLVLSFLGLMATTWATDRLLRRSFPTHLRPYVTPLSVFFALATNQIALAFTGMEHNLHIAVVAWGLVGLVEWQTTRTVPAWFIGVIVLNPLLRFEGLALSVLLISLLAYHKAYRPAALALGSIVLIFGLYAWMMWVQGLPIVPSSISDKSAVVDSAVRAHASFLTHIFESLGENLTQRAAAVLIAINLASFLLAANSPPLCKRNTMDLAFISLLALGGHLALGRFGWLFRYEIYALVLSTLILCVILGRVLGQIPRRQPALKNPLLRIINVGTFGVLTLFAMYPYIHNTAMTPHAAANIFRQQYQMHTLAALFYNQPVAVNDIGLVSFENDNYVLDLWGLADDDIRKARTTPAVWLSLVDARMRDHHVGLVMLYDNWFEGLGMKPLYEAVWQKVGVLRFKGPVVSAAQRTVDIYLTPYGDAKTALEAIKHWEKSLPEGKTSFIWEKQRP